LTKRYGDRVAVDGLDLDVEPGEIFGFLGPNGAGKTTVIRLLLGLIEADDGEAWLLGERVPCPDQLRSVGAMVEEPAFYPWMTGRRNLQVLADTGGGLPGSATDATLDLIGLASVADRKVKTYSQGMRQRLGLAVALMRQPKVALLDEPANGLDPAGIREFRELLRQLGQAGTTVFLSSHQLAEVEQVCERVAVIDGGRLRSVGPVGELGGLGELARIRVEVEPDDTERAAQLLHAWPTVIEAPGVVLVRQAGGRQINGTLSAGGVIASSIVAEHLSLEQRFLSITTVPEGASDDAAAAS
jgi:ABC-2 type transport system ATP-binding protein